MKTLVCLISFSAVVICASTAEYNVGPNQSLTSISQVPWTTLTTGDVVNIHWKAEPYREKWVICRRGSAERPIVVRGIPNRFGQYPVISGENAATPVNLDFWGENRGLLKIGGASVPADTIPSHILIENLEFRGAYHDYNFTNDQGTVETYADNAAAIYVEKAQNLTIRNCTLTDSGNGLFVGAFSGATTNILIQFCHIFGNGNPGRFYEHNSYTEAHGIIFEGNWYGPLRESADGNNLKDRSAGLIVRYNWIEGGNRQLDLVESHTLNTLPAYSNTYVYGNILLEPDNDGNSQIVHYGGDSGTSSDYRKGTLRFFNNTVISKRTGNTTLFRLSTNDEYADCRNNLLFVTDSGNYLAWLDGTGILDIRCNWAKTGIVSTHGSLTGTITNHGGEIRGTAPGFVYDVQHSSQAYDDYHLITNSTCINAATGTPLQVTREYLKHLRTTVRHDDSHPDIGAFELNPDLSITDNCLFIHHSCGNNWLHHNLLDALLYKDYVDEYNNIYYGTDLQPDSGRPDSLGGTPGNHTDMNHWVRWFNDYLDNILTHECTSGTNRIVMFKSCYPNSDISSDGTLPGDPFSSQKTLTNYKAVYRHANGSGGAYTNNSYVYKPLEDIFAEHPEILFIPVTAPTLHQSTSSDANAHRARLFNNWLKNDWQPDYLSRHPTNRNVAVLDWFDFLATSDSNAIPNRLKTEYGGTSGNSHPNTTANEASTVVFAEQKNNFFDIAWDDFCNNDHDGDNMSDWWERKYSLNTEDDSDAGHNSDSDQLDNLQEFVADTDPSDSSSCFQVTAVSNLSTLTIHFNSSGNRKYTMLACANLLTDAWTNAPGCAPHMGAGGADSITVSNSLPTQFYKLRVEIP